MAYFWTLNNAKQEDAIVILKQGMTALPFRSVLVLCYFLCSLLPQLSLDIIILRDPGAAEKS